MQEKKKLKIKKLVKTFIINYHTQSHLGYAKVILKDGDGKGEDYRKIMNDVISC
jgi:hypothetical protein